MSWREEVLSGKCCLMIDRYEKRAFARQSLWSVPKDSDEVDYEEAKAFAAKEGLVEDGYCSSYYLSVYGIPERCSGSKPPAE